MGRNAQSVIDEEESLFDGDQGEKDSVTNALFLCMSKDSMAQELLQLLFKSFTLTVQSILPDYLPGGEYYSVTDPIIIAETKASAYTTTPSSGTRLCST